MSVWSKRRARRTIRPAVVARSKQLAGVVMHDTSGRLIVASEQAATLLGFAAPDALVGRPALFEDGRTIRHDGMLVRADDQPAAIALRTGQPVESVRIGVLQVDASVRWFEVSAKPLFRVGVATPYAVVSRFTPVRQRRGDNGSTSRYAIDRLSCQNATTRSARHHKR
jgi:PAS domain-containing protein